MNGKAGRQEARDDGPPHSRWSKRQSVGMLSCEVGECKMRGRSDAARWATIVVIVQKYVEALSSVSCMFESNPKNAT